MKVSNVKRVEQAPSAYKVRKVERRAVPFEGTDAIAEWHKNRTKSSMAEAFKDSEYCIAIQGQKSEWQDFVEFAGGLLIISPFVFVAFYVAFIILKALGIVVVL